MSTIPTHDAPLVHEPNILRGFPTNREPLLFLTWITGQPQIADLKNGLASGGDPSRLLPAQLIGRLSVFESDHYGPVYRALVYHRLTQVDWSAVSQALQGMREISVVQTNETSDMETTILWDIASQQPQICRALRHMAQTWQDPSDLARQLRLHFECKCQQLLVRSTSECLSLVSELLLLSLERVDWSEIATRLLGLHCQRRPHARSHKHQDRRVRRS